MGLTRNVTAGVRSLRKGEVPEYTELLEDARRHAIDRMVANAKLLGANAIVSMRFDSSEMGSSLTEVVAYGTAVVVERRLTRSRRCSAATTRPAGSRPTSSSSGSTSRSATRPHDALAGLPPLDAPAAEAPTGAPSRRTRHRRADVGADQGALHRPQHAARDARVGRPRRPPTTLHR